MSSLKTMIVDIPSTPIQISENQAGVPVGCLRISGIFAVVDKKNRNQRIYERGEYKKHLDLLQAKIAKGLLGELEHPKGRMTIDYENASHKIETAYLDESTGLVKGSVLLLDTPKGQIIQSIVKVKVPVYISSRAMGVVASNGVVKLDDLATYDIVSDPGFIEAELSMMNESRSYQRPSSKMYTYLFEDVSMSSSTEKKTINKNDMTQKQQERLLEQNRRLRANQQTLSKQIKLLTESVAKLNKRTSGRVSESSAATGVTGIKNQHKLLMHVREMLDTRISALADATEKWIKEEYSGGLQSWIFEQFAPKIQDWLTTEYSGKLQSWITEEYSAKLQEWITTEYADKNQEWLQEHFATGIQNWIINEYTPMLEGWIKKEYTPGIEQWMIKEFAPALTKHNVKVNERVEARKRKHFATINESKIRKAATKKTLMTKIDEQLNRARAIENTQQQSVLNENQDFLNTIPTEFRLLWEGADQDLKLAIVNESKSLDLGDTNKRNKFWFDRQARLIAGNRQVMTRLTESKNRVQTQPQLAFSNEFKQMFRKIK